LDDTFRFAQQLEDEVGSMLKVFDRDLFSPTLAADFPRGLPLSVDIKETDTNVQIHADVPGIAADDIKVRKFTLFYSGHTIAGTFALLEVSLTSFTSSRRLAACTCFVRASLGMLRCILAYIYLPGVSVSSCYLARRRVWLIRVRACAQIGVVLHPIPSGAASLISVIALF
jgi:hypothetical protein